MMSANVKNDLLVKNSWLYIFFFPFWGDLFPKLTPIKGYIFILYYVLSPAFAQSNQGRQNSNQLLCLGIHICIIKANCLCTQPGLLQQLSLVIGLSNVHRNCLKLQGLLWSVCLPNKRTPPDTRSARLLLTFSPTTKASRTGRCRWVCVCGGTPAVQPQSLRTYTCRALLSRCFGNRTYLRMSNRREFYTSIK